MDVLGQAQTSYDKVAAVANHEAPAGWYPNPWDGGASLMYWDGWAWTGRTQPRPQPSNSPPTAPYAGLTQASSQATAGASPPAASVDPLIGRRRLLGFLPNWRIFTYAILAVNVLFVVRVVVAAVSTGSSTNCGAADQKTCEAVLAPTAGGSQIAAAVFLFVLLAVVDVVLVVIWLATRPSKYFCPRCRGAAVKGAVRCGHCGLISEHPIATPAARNHGPYREQPSFQEPRKQGR